ncbi:MAG: nucleoside deaminase [Legionella sp.]|nr:nucleoside deaminase [Legionella sp.]
MNNNQLIEPFLHIIEHSIVPLTQQAILSGNKIFGAAIIKKSDLSVIIAATNAEVENPLWHGEVNAIKKLYELPPTQRPLPKDCYFLATHEPCSLCLSAITWAGFDNIYYLFDYNDSNDVFHIPHDLHILQAVFHCQQGQYAHHNHYWNSYHLIELLDGTDAPVKQKILKKALYLRGIYTQMSNIYQQSKQPQIIPLP